MKGPDHPGTPILHIGEFTRGKGKFHAIDHLPPAELPDAEYPILLTTGRVLYHWHGGEMTRRAKGLLEVYPESLVEIHPEDALKIGLNGNRRVTVTSRRGEMIAQALVTDRVSPGMIFANFHFPGEQNVNNVTIFALDPGGEDTGVQGVRGKDRARRRTGRGGGRERERTTDCASRNLVMKANHRILDFRNRPPPPPSRAIC